MRKRLFWFALFAALFAWFGKDGRAQPAQTAAHFIVGGTLPATCNPQSGDVIALVSGTTATYYNCTAANTWGAATFTSDTGVKVYTTAVTNPASAPTVTPTCTGTCLTTYGYKTYKVLGSTADLVSGGYTSALSPEQTVSNAATLDGTHFNTITVPLDADPNVLCGVIRTTGPNSPLVLSGNAPFSLQVFTCNGTSTYVDNQAVAYGGVPPVINLPAANNTLGEVLLKGNLVVPNSGWAVGTVVAQAGTTSPIFTIDALYTARLSSLNTQADGSWQWVNNIPANPLIHGDMQTPGEAWLVKTVNAANSPYTITRNETLVECDATTGNRTMTLPNPGADAYFLSGRMYVVHKTDSSANTCTLTASTGTIDGASTYILAQPFESVTVFWDGTNWPTYSRTKAGVGAATTGAVTISSAATDTKVAELSLPAGYLNAVNKTFRIEARGIYTTTGITPTLTHKVKLCTVSGCGSGTVLTLYSAPATGATTSGASNTWVVQGALGTISTGATGTVMLHADACTVLGASGATACTPTIDANTAASSTIDLTAALFLDWMVNASAVTTLTETPNVAYIHATD